MCIINIVRNEGCNHNHEGRVEQCGVRRLGLCKKTQDKVHLDEKKWICDNCNRALKRAVDAMKNKRGMLNEC